jgi:hypothetical protein
MYQIGIFGFSRPSQIYPNWDFWFKNIQSGSPGLNDVLLQVLINTRTGKTPLTADAATTHREKRERFRKKEDEGKKVKEKEKKKGE